MSFLHSSVSKESACNAGDPGSNPRLGRFPGEGNGNVLQYCCLENPVDRGDWCATVYGVKRVRYNLATIPLRHSENYLTTTQICQGHQNQGKSEKLSQPKGAHGLQHTRLLRPSPTPGVCSNSCSSSRWCIQLSHSLLSPSPALNLSQHQGLFKVHSSHQMAKVMEFQLQH